MSARMGLALLALALGGCADAPPPPRTSSRLGEGVVASVAGEAVAGSTVARIAARQGVTLEEALDQAIYDALFAAAAREDLSPADLAHEEARLLAHALLRELWLGLQDVPIRDAELEEAAEQLWTHWDRPVAYRTVQLVVRADRAKATAEQLVAAQELAERMRSVVEPAAAMARTQAAPELDEEAMFTTSKRRLDDAAEKRFLVDARAVDVGDADVVVESLPPCTADGRVVDHETSVSAQRFDLAFSEAVAALGERGNLSQVFASPFGYHVVLLLEVTPAHRTRRSERLAGLGADIVRVRGTRAKRKLLARLRSEIPVELPRNVDGQLRSVTLRAEGP